MISVAAAKVLAAFLNTPRREQYGFGLMKTTNLKSGTLYPLLDRFERSGWLEEFDEDIDEVAVGRPKRRLYRPTAQGEREARQAVAELYRALGPAPRWLSGLERA